MKAAEEATGAGACAKALEDVTPHRGPDARKKTLGVRPGELKPRPQSLLSRHKWAASGVRVPGLEQGFQSTLERDGDVATVLGGLEVMGLKGSPHVDHVFTSILLV